MSQNLHTIIEKAALGQRINSSEALELWQHGDFYDMGKTAHGLRNRAISAKEVSYTFFRIINYTDVCTIDCSFCSFKHGLNDENSYVLSEDEVLQKTREAYEQDCRQIFFQGGVHPSLPLSYYTSILKKIHQEFPDVHIRGFSPVEILNLSKISGKNVSNTLDILIEAGLQSFPGAGAEILSERMRSILSEKKASPEDWFAVMKTALSKGLKGSTNIVWGSVEEPHEIIEHLSIIRRLQDETGNVVSFVPWTFQKQTKGFPVRNVTAREYLKMISLSRIFLDNIPNIEVSLLVKGASLGEVALSFGANDINSPVLEENVLRSYGLKSPAECEEFIENAGYKPVRRNFNYERGKKS